MRGLNKPLVLSSSVRHIFQYLDTWLKKAPEVCTANVSKQKGSRTSNINKCISRKIIAILYIFLYKTGVIKCLKRHYLIRMIVSIIKHENLFTIKLTRTDSLIVWKNISIFLNIIVNFPYNYVDQSALWMWRKDDLQVFVGHLPIRLIVIPHRIINVKNRHLPSSDIKIEIDI